MKRLVIVEVRWIAAIRGWSLVAFDSSWRSATNSSSALTPRTMSTLRAVCAVDKAVAGWMEMTEENGLIFHRLWMLEIFHRRQERHLGH